MEFDYDHDDERRSVSLQVRVWLESDGSIRLAVPGIPEPMVMIKNDPDRPSGHPKLYRYLAQRLRDRGAPAPGSD